MFVDTGVGNYLLKTNSAAVNAALLLAAGTNDLEGNARPSGPAPDIGCYEQSPLRLQIATQTNGGFQLKVYGGAGKTYQLDSSVALTNWTTLAQFVRSNRPIEWTTTNGSAQRFYRATATP
jgi:hypothetical protein